MASVTATSSALEPLIESSSSPSKNSTGASVSKKASKGKKASSKKTLTSHPKYMDMVVAAISALKERTGSSRQAIVKYIMANYSVGNDQKPVNIRTKIALRNGCEKGTLKQTKGCGASGSFRVLDKSAKSKDDVKDKASIKKVSGKVVVALASSSKRSTGGGASSSSKVPTGTPAKKTDLKKKRKTKTEKKTTPAKKVSTKKISVKKSPKKAVVVADKVVKKKKAAVAVVSKKGGATPKKSLSKSKATKK